MSYDPRDEICTKCGNELTLHDYSDCDTVRSNGGDPMSYDPRDEICTKCGKELTLHDYGDCDTVRSNGGDLMNECSYIDPVWDDYIEEGG